MAKRPDNNNPQPTGGPPDTAGPGSAPRIEALPPARDRDRLAAALEMFGKGGVTLDQAAEAFGIDPEQLHRWSHRSSKGARPAGKKVAPAATAGETPAPQPTDPKPKRERPLPALLPKDEQSQFTQNWDTAAGGIETDPQLSLFDTALEKFPPLAWFLGSDRRRLGTALLAGLLLLTGIIYLAREKPVSSPPTAPPETPPAISALPDEDDHAAATRAAHSFLAAGTVEARMLHVRDPKRILPLARDWYSRPENQGDLAPVSDASTLNAIGIVLHGHRISVLELASGEQRFAIPVVLTADGDAKIEWEAAVGYSPVSWNSFADGRHPGPVAFRVSCSPADYYNIPFEDDKVFDAYRLSPPKMKADPADRPLYGYVRKGSVVAQYIHSLRRSSPGRVNLILALGFPAEGFKDCVEILAVEAESWIDLKPQPSD